MPNGNSQVFNDDIVGLVRRINRFIMEMVKSASANVADMNTFDQTRLTQYITMLRAYLAWVQAQPQLDLPETHPHALDVPEAPVVPETMENDSVMDICRLLERARGEVINSQSARNAVGLIPFDMNRCSAVVDKVEKLLTDFIQQVQPIDLPESSPRSPDTGSGRGGINP